jgi:hypothetical protein
MTIILKYKKARLELEIKLMDHNGPLFLDYSEISSEFLIKLERSPRTVFKAHGPNPWGLTRKGITGPPTFSEDNIKFFIEVDKLPIEVENLVKSKK